MEPDIDERVAAWHVWSSTNLDKSTAERWEAYCRFMLDIEPNPHPKERTDR